MALFTFRAPSAEGWELYLKVGSLYGGNPTNFPIKGMATYIPASLDFLEQALSGDKKIAQSALSEISRSSLPPEKLFRLVKKASEHSDAVVKQNAMVIIRKSNKLHPLAGGIIEVALKDSDHMVRYNALCALREWSSPLDVFVPTLKTIQGSDTNMHSRRVASEVLNAIKK